MKTEIKTKRLTLCPMSDAEIEALIERTPSDELRAAYGEMLSGGKSDPENRVWYAPWSMVLKDAQEYVGDLGFKGPVKKHAVEIGYGVLPEYEGQGYTTEAVQAMTPMGVSAEGCGVCGGRNRPGEQGFAACSRKVRLCAGRNNGGGRPAFCAGEPAFQPGIHLYAVWYRHRYARWTDVRPDGLGLGARHQSRFVGRRAARQCRKEKT